MHFIKEEKEKYGIVDYNDKTVLPSIYDDISLELSDFNWEKNDDYAIVKQNNKFAYYYPKEKQFLTKFSFHKAYPFIFNLARVITKKKGNYTISFINNKGMPIKGIEFKITKTEFLNYKSLSSYSNLKWNDEMLAEVKEIISTENCQKKIFDDERTLYFVKPGVMVVSYRTELFYMLDKIEYKKFRIEDIYPLQIPSYTDSFSDNGVMYIVLEYDNTKSKINNLYTYNSIVVNPVIYNFLFDHQVSEYLQILYKQFTDYFATEKAYPLFKNPTSFFIKMMNVIGAYSEWEDNWLEMKRIKEDDAYWMEWNQDRETISPILALFQYPQLACNDDEYWKGRDKLDFAILDAYDTKSISMLGKCLKFISEMKEIPFSAKFRDMSTLDIRFFIVSYMIATIHNYLYTDNNIESEEEKNAFIDNSKTIYKERIISANKILDDYFYYLVEEWEKKC